MRVSLNSQTKLHDTGVDGEVGWVPEWGKHVGVLGADMRRLTDWRPDSAMSTNSQPA